MIAGMQMKSSARCFRSARVLEDSAGLWILTDFEVDPNCLGFIFSCEESYTPRIDRIFGILWHSRIERMVSEGFFEVRHEFHTVE